MIPILAWKNVWRSRTRSLVVMGAVAVGIWALLFLLSFSQGMMESYIESAIENQTSHLQIHHKEFLKDKEIKYFIDSSDAILNAYKKDEQVANATLRTISNGMIATAKGARGVNVKGVDPKTEALVSQLDKKLIEGKYFDANSSSSNPIIISKNLADKLNTKLRKKVVLTCQTPNNEPVQASFKVVGIYSTGNAQLDQMLVYTRKEDINRLLGIDDKAGHEIAVLLKDMEQIYDFQEARKAKSDTTKYAIQTYDEIAPELKLFNEQMSMSTGIMTFIIMFALIFGIINTMLMAVLERTKELGMLMAIGMNKGKVFLTIVFETIMLSVIGAPIGMFIGFVSIFYTNKVGINMSMYQKGLEQFGMSGTVHPSLTSDAYITVGVAIVITALLASIYPALKAIRLKPVEGLRKI
jgi:putative ABC transport system permease protein